MAGCTPWLSGPGFTPGFFVVRCQLRAPARREDDDNRSRLHPVREIDDVFVEHADAAGRDGLTDIFRLVGTVDAIERVLRPVCLLYTSDAADE